MEDDFVTELASVRRPALLILGSQDTLVRMQDQASLLAALPEAQLVVHQQAGHALHWEVPEWFTDALVQFVTALEAGNPVVRQASVAGK